MGWAHFTNTYSIIIRVRWIFRLNLIHGFDIATQFLPMSGQHSFCVMRNNLLRSIPCSLCKTSFPWNLNDGEKSLVIYALATNSFCRLGWNECAINPHYMSQGKITFATKNVWCNHLSLLYHVTMNSVSLQRSPFYPKYKQKHIWSLMCGLDWMCLFSFQILIYFLLLWLIYLLYSMTLLYCFTMSLDCTRYLGPILLT